MSITQRTAIATIIRNWNLGILSDAEAAHAIRETYLTKGE